jgi:outer membrane protein TolC
LLSKRVVWGASLRSATLFGVATSYFSVLKGERVVEVNQKSLGLAQEQETLAQKRADVGEVTRSDVLRAQVSVEIAGGR